MPEDLEQLVKRKESIGKKVADAMKKFLGVKIEEINEDISSKILNPSLHIEINTKLKYKKAKEQFKKRYVIQLLQQTAGNVSKAAEISGIERRSLHRLITKYKIKNVRKGSYTPEAQKEDYVYTVVEETLDKYAITKQKKQELKKVDVKDITTEMQEIRITFKEAIQQFDKKYLAKLLKENGNNKIKAAKKSGIAKETLQRKMNSLGIK